MDGKRWQDRVLEPVRSTLGKLGAAQRLSLGLLGASLLVGLGTLALGGRSDKAMTLVPIADATQAQDFAGWLTEERIPHEVTASGVAVRHADLPYVQLRARVLHAEGNQADYFQFVDQAASLTESASVRQERWSVGNKREIADVLRRCEGIRHATVTFTPSKQRTAILRRQDDGATAAVHLTVDRSRYPEGRLPPSLARVVGQHVAAALGLNIRNVTVMDDAGNGYDLSASAALAAGGDAPEARIRAKVSDLVEQSFPVGAFTVIVDVSQNLRPSAIVEHSIDPDEKLSLPTRKVSEKARDTSGALAPGLKPNVAVLGAADTALASADEYERSETDFENAYGRREVRTEVPPGEVEGVTVTLEVDLATAVSILQEEQRIKGNTAWEGKGEALQQELERFREQWRTKLEQHSSLAPERVKAQVDFSVRPRAPETAAGAIGGRSALGWLGDNAGSLVLVLLSLGGGVLLLRAARSGIPEPEDLPDPVAELEQFLARREARIAAETAALAESGGARAGVPWGLADDAKGAIDLIEEVTRYAQEQPAVATSVVKQWLHAAPSGRGEPVGEQS